MDKLRVMSRGTVFALTAVVLGVAAAAQGLVVLCLELPTGGLADAVGRRPVLLGATAVIKPIHVRLTQVRQEVWVVIACAAAHRPQDRLRPAP